MLPRSAAVAHLTAEFLQNNFRWRTCRERYYISQPKPLTFDHRCSLLLWLALALAGENMTLRLAAAIFQ